MLLQDQYESLLTKMPKIGSDTIAMVGIDGSG